MSEPQSLELISFKLCPYVQRAVILLKEKALDFKVTYIDLKNKPDWFFRLSPLGKVPVLKVGDTVLFESAVIAEYLDETNPPTLHPTDPLLKARNRAWIEFSSELLMLLYRLVRAGDEEEFYELAGSVRRNLERLEGEIAGEPYFNGEAFALVDAAFAPAFMRLALVESGGSYGMLDGLPKVSRWSQALLERPAVRESVVPEFSELFFASLRDSGGYLGGKGV